MKTRKWIEQRLSSLESEMEEQVEVGMSNGWPVLFWDKNCVERALLREILELEHKPFCAADTMAGW